jgi:ankyrin repeat protein
MLMPLEENTGKPNASPAFLELTKKYSNALMAILGDYHQQRANNVAPMFNFLIGRGANVNSPPSEEHTSALQAAIDQDQDQFVDRLLDAGADINAHDSRFGTALTTAAKWGDISLMKKLLEHDADPHLAGEKFG